MSDEQRLVVPGDLEERRRWLLDSVGALSPTQCRYLQAFDGENDGEAVAAAGVGASAVRNWRFRSPLFAEAERFIRDGRRGLMSELARAKLERASAAAADELIDLALRPADTARGVTAKMSAIAQLLDRGGVTAPKESPISVNVDARRIEVTASEMWAAGGSDAWRQRRVIEPEDDTEASP